MAYFKRLTGSKLPKPVAKNFHRRTKSQANTQNNHLLIPHNINK
jgi:hypothetical protein